MKKVFLFSSHWSVYLTEIPVLALLAIVISVHDSAPSIVKFYPLEIVLGGVALLILLFFFRAVQISRDEIREIGRFSSRDKATIEEGKILVFTLARKKHLTVELYERSDAAPALPWAGDVSGETNLFRARTRGNIKAVHRTLLCFGVSPEEADAVLKALPEKEIVFENVAIRAEVKHDVVIYRLRILQTL